MPTVYNKLSGKYDGDASVRVVVLHHTAGILTSDLNTLWGSAQVSIHVYITKSGIVYLGVPLGKRAWHCGKSQWAGLSDINSYSIGIELENWGDSQDPFTPAQLSSLDWVLVTLIRPQYGNLPITRHRDISLEGKTDPANNFPWDIYQGGIGQVARRMTVTGATLNEEEDMGSPLMNADVDGDGKQELYCLYNYGDANTGLFRFKPDPNNPDKFIATPVWVSGKGNFDYSRVVPPK